MPSGVRCCRASTTVIEAADAASVVVPSSLHAEVAVPLLDAGLHCLIEKPFVTTEADGLRGARRRRVIRRPRARRPHRAVQPRGAPATRDPGGGPRRPRRRRPADERGQQPDHRRRRGDRPHGPRPRHRRRPRAPARRRPRRTSRSRPREAPATTTSACCSPSKAVRSRRSPPAASPRTRVRELQVTTDSRFFTVDYANQELLDLPTGPHRRARARRTTRADTCSTWAPSGSSSRGSSRSWRRSRTSSRSARGEADPEVSGAHGLAVMRLVWDIHAALGKGAVDG